MQSGVSFGDVDYSFDAATLTSDPFEYTDIVIGPDGEPVVEPAPHVPDGTLILAMVQLGAAALAPARRFAAERFATGPSPSAPALRTRGWAVADAGSASTPVVAGTWAEAQAAVAEQPGRVLVPMTELAG